MNLPPNFPNDACSGNNDKMHPKKWEAYKVIPIGTFTAINIPLDVKDYQELEGIFDAIVRLNIPKSVPITLSEERIQILRDAHKKKYDEDQEKIKKMVKLRAMKNFDDLFQKEWDSIIQTWKQYAGYASLQNEETHFYDILPSIRLKFSTKNVPQW